MRRSCVFALTVAGLSAGCAAAAAAAGVWSSPQTVSRPHDFLGSGAVAYTANGTAVATWQWSGATRSNGSVERTSMAARPASRAAFGPEHDLTALLVAGPLPYGANRVMIATQIDDVDTTTRAIRSSTLRVQFGDVQGHFGRPHVILRSSVQINGGVGFVANRRGDAALYWGNRLRLRRRGGAFGPPIALARGASCVAIGPTGDVLLAYEDHGVHTRYRGRADSAFGRAQTLRSRPTRGAYLHCALPGDGTAWLAWLAQWRTEGGTISTPYIQIARRPPGAHRFDPALLLAKGGGAGGDYATGISFAAAPNGTAGAAWTTWHDETEPATTTETTVRVGRVDAAGTATVESLVHHPDDSPGATASFALADGGDAAVAWIAQTSPATIRAFVSLPPAAGGWSAPERVDADVRAGDVLASYAPRGGPLTLLIRGALKTAGDARMLVIARRQPRTPAAVGAAGG